MGRRVGSVVEVMVEKGIVGSGTAVSAGRNCGEHHTAHTCCRTIELNSVGLTLSLFCIPAMDVAPPAADAASGYAGAADSINAGQAPARKANRFSLISNLLEDMGVTQEQKLVLAICMCCIMLYWRYTGAIGPNKKKR